jgi:hypothetical protein
LHEETKMRNKIPLSALAAVLAAVLAPSVVHAYGAAHVGYTHVGPNGVYHTGATAAAGPGGAYAGGRTTAAGGYGGYHYGGAAVGGYRYVR